jgi:hypothetical protein
MGAGGEGYGTIAGCDEPSRWKSAHALADGRYLSASTTALNAAEDWRRHPHIRCNSHDNHIFGDLFATAHARIVTVGNDVAEAPLPY